jgi:hypothetical protein
VSKARDLLGFEAKIDLDEGIRRTADYYRKLYADAAGVRGPVMRVGEPFL